MNFTKGSWKPVTEIERKKYDRRNGISVSVADNRRWVEQKSIKYSREKQKSSDYNEIGIV